MMRLSGTTFGIACVRNCLFRAGVQADQSGLERRHCDPNRARRRQCNTGDRANRELSTCLFKVLCSILGCWYFGIGA